MSIETGGRGSIGIAKGASRGVSFEGGRGVVTGLRGFSGHGIEKSGGKHLPSFSLKNTVPLEARGNFSLDTSRNISSLARPETQSPISAITKYKQNPFEGLAHYKPGKPAVTDTFKPAHELKHTVIQTQRKAEGGNAKSEHIKSVVEQPQVAKVAAQKPEISYSTLQDKVRKLQTQRERGGVAKKAGDAHSEAEAKPKALAQSINKELGVTRRDETSVAKIPETNVSQVLKEHVTALVEPVTKTVPKEKIENLRVRYAAQFVNNQDYSNKERQGNLPSLKQQELETEFVQATRVLEAYKAVAASTNSGLSEADAERTVLKALDEKLEKTGEKQLLLEPEQQAKKPETTQSNLAQEKLSAREQSPVITDEDDVAALSHESLPQLEPVQTELESSTNLHTETAETPEMEIDTQAEEMTESNTATSQLTQPSSPKASVPHVKTKNEEEEEEERRQKEQEEQELLEQKQLEFERDEELNEIRKETAEKVTEVIFEYKKDIPVEGGDIAELMPDDPGPLGSVIVHPGDSDGAYQEALHDISQLGEIHNEQEADEKIRDIFEANTAVKIGEVRNVTEYEVQKVLRGPIYSDATT